VYDPLTSHEPPPSSASPLNRCFANNYYCITRGGSDSPVVLNTIILLSVFYILNL